MKTLIRKFKNKVRPIKRRIDIALARFRRMCKNAAACLRDNGVISAHTINPDSKIEIRRFLGKTLSMNAFSTQVRMGGGGTQSREMFYLKVNRIADYTIPCIQGWLNVIACMGADYCIVCDNKRLESKILRECYFPDGEIRIIKSMTKPMAGYIWNIQSGSWYFTTLAHLTPFYDAKQRGITRYWCVDADDTTFLMSVDRLCDALRKVADNAVKNDIAACSLDMCYSLFRGRHWSLGVLYINDFCDFISLFERCDSRAWMNNFGDMDCYFNLDWYMTWLKKNGLARIETFYIEDSKFVHWGPLLTGIGTDIYHWKEGKLCFLFTREYYQNEELGTIDIADGCIKIVSPVSEIPASFQNTQYQELIAQYRGRFSSRMRFKEMSPLTAWTSAPADQR